MRALLLLPALSLVLSAQVPVDYAALKAEMRGALKTAFQNPGGGAPAAPQALASLRARSSQAKGEQKEALLIAEFFLLTNLQKPNDLGPRILLEVSASSPAWQMAEGLLPDLNEPGLLGASAGTYIQQMREKGCPAVRAEFQARDVEGMLEVGKVEEAKALVARLEKEFPGLATVVAVRKSLDAELATILGKEAPDFKVENLEDAKATFTKASFQGKYLLMDFWGTWCGWCVKELPTTHKLYAKYKGKGLEILSLASDKNPEAVKAFRRKPGTPMPWKHAFIGSGKDLNPVMNAYGVQGFPSLFLIGPDGKLLAKNDDLRAENLEKTLARFLR